VNLHRTQQAQVCVDVTVVMTLFDIRPVISKVQILELLRTTVERRYESGGDEQLSRTGKANLVLKR
jgi:hypothetical protein